MTNSRDRKRPKIKLNRQEGRRPKLSQFARTLLREWKKLRLPDQKASVVVAVSGGADSVGLLFALDELIKSNRLKINLIVAHLNHKLRSKASDADAEWVRSMARKLGHVAVIKAVNVRAGATKKNDNLEQAARRSRYEFLEKTARSKKATVILAAHTQDDQAETVLLNLMRGSGPSGLSGIDSVRPIRDGSEILLVRPFLSWARRADTEAYCRHRHIDFRLDEMNEDERFARVRVRKQLLPLIQTFNPRFVEGLMRTTEILREDSAALENAAARLLELSLGAESLRKNGRPLRADLLRLAQPAVRRRALRQWISSCRGDLRRIEHVHILAVENFLFNTRSARMIELPGGGRILRTRGLFFCEIPANLL